MTGPFDKSSHYGMGQNLIVPPGTMCDKGDGNVAIHRIVNGGDAENPEFTDLCDDCYKADRAEAEPPSNEGECDRCGMFFERRVPYRDVSAEVNAPEEMICQGCLDKLAEESQRALDEIVFDDAEVGADDESAEAPTDDDDYQELDNVDVD